MLKLHGFAQSGNTFKVAFLLRALGVPWQPVHLAFADFVRARCAAPHGAKASTRWARCRCWKKTTARRSSQSGVILTMLAERHGAFGGNERGRAPRSAALAVLRQPQVHQPFRDLALHEVVRRQARPTRPSPPTCARRIDAAFGIVDKHLAGRAFIVGDALTIADMSLSGYLFYPAEESGYVLEERFPNLAAWRDSLRGAPGWGDPYEVLPGERIAPRW